MLLLKNIRLLRTLFVLLVFILFLVSCRNKKEIANTTPRKKNESSAKPSPVAIKYAARLNVEPKVITNEKLYAFIEEWYSAPYKYGGNEKTGIDCSGFACRLYESVYTKKIARSSKDIYAS